MNKSTIYDGNYVLKYVYYKSKQYTPQQAKFDASSTYLLIENGRFSLALKGLSTINYDGDVLVENINNSYLLVFMVNNKILAAGNISGNLIAFTYYDNKEMSYVFEKANVNTTRINRVAGTNEIVRIKMPVVLQAGYIGMLSSRQITVYDNHGRILWTGRQGEIASFYLCEPTYINVDLGKFANRVTGLVRPNGKYVLTVDSGVHWKSQYRLSEVDMLVG